MKTENRIWFDLTHSMNWHGGIVGIVRVELELAAALKKRHSNIAFSVYKNGAFHEVHEHEVPWVNESENLGDAYLKKNPVKNVTVSNATLNAKLDKYFSALKTQHPGRVARMQQSLLLLASALPLWLQVLSVFIVWPINKLLSLVSKLYGMIKPNHISKTLAQPQIQTLNNHNNIHPFGRGDIIINAGWWNEEKQNAYKKLKASGANVYLSYFVYDTILINKSTRHLYSEELEISFKKYFVWISEVCDFVFYGGETAKLDSEAHQQQYGLRTPKGTAIKLATKITLRESTQNELSLLGICGDFFLCVGTIEPRKNHETLYKAYITLLEKGIQDLPQLVFAGRTGEGTADLIDTIKRDPRIRKKLLLITPTDAELASLYSACLFTLLPTYYEGWSLTLPESLGYGKFCLAADVAPLKEVGENLVDYIYPTDVAEWANKIEYFHRNRFELQRREAFIKENWRVTTWDDCAKAIVTSVESFLHGQFPVHVPSTAWMDMTVSYLLWNGGVTGIIRSELILAHQLKKLIPGLKFYAFHGSNCFEIPEKNLQWLFQSSDVATGYENFQKHWKKIESRGEGSRIPQTAGEQSVSSKIPHRIIAFLANAAPPELTRFQRIKTAFGIHLSFLPPKLSLKVIDKVFRFFPSIRPNPKLLDFHEEPDSFYPALMAENIKIEIDRKIEFSKSQPLPFSDGDIVFSAGIHWDFSPLIEIIKAKEKTKFYYSQIIYDLTPLNTPHLHVPEASYWYTGFFYLAGLASNQIIYGGKTALYDGQKWQTEMGWHVTPGMPVKFGSDIASAKDKGNDNEVLEELGINGRFILAVGTIENRKNHDTLYKAYLKLLDQQADDLPQLVFVGGPGWKVQNLLQTIKRDRRVQGKLLILRTTDQQLDVLYRNCLFTVLASLYEGWSLTLPESLSYGKFCLTSAVAPLQETGRDLVDYVHPWDVSGWAEKIMFYSASTEALAERERRILQEWHPISWEDCAKQIAKILSGAATDLNREMVNE